MDKKKTDFIKDIKEFMKKANRLIKVDKFILFGSRANKTAKKGSDIDLLVISKDFEEVKSFKRSPSLYLLWDAPYDIDIICLTPYELSLKMKEVGVIRQAMKEGIEL